MLVIFGMPAAISFMIVQISIDHKGNKLFSAIFEAIAKDMELNYSPQISTTLIKLSFHQEWGAA